MEGLIEGAVLAVLVVFLFLRDFRATVISAIAIPLSAIPAFWFMSLMGITLNGLSLLALSLVAGVLVDDAIVEIENIVRHMRMGKTAYQASMDAADEIGLAVVATTMSIVAVFLPVALMPGISGQFFKAFGYTVVIAVMMSLFVARMITPLIAAYFLKAHGVQPHAAGPAMIKYLDVLKWSLDTSKADARLAALPGNSGRWYHHIGGGLLVGLRIIAFAAGAAVVFKAAGAAGVPNAINLLLALIGGVIGFIVSGKLLSLLIGLFDTPFARTYRHWGERWGARRQDHRFTMVGIGTAAFAIQIALFMGLSLSFQPPLNLDFSRVRIGMPPGTTLEQTEAVADRAAAIIEKDPSVDRVFQRVFVGSGFLNIVLKKDREVTSVEFERSLTPQMAAIPDAQVNFLSQGGGGPGSGGRDIALYLGSDNPELLNDTANKIVDEMTALPELRAPRAVGDLVRPEITDHTAFRPCRGPWCYHLGAEPDDSHRDAWRHRPEQREILARRPSGANHRVAARERPPGSFGA